MPNIVEITDLSSPELAVYARLTQAQLRNRLEPEKGIFIAESPKVIAESNSEYRNVASCSPRPFNTPSTILSRYMNGATKPKSCTYRPTLASR